MGGQTARLMYILITFALVNYMSTVQARDNTRRRMKPKTGGFQKNICDITDRDSKVHCYCENTREPRNATKAECWVFKGGISHDDVVWQSFASQPTLQTLSIQVRVDGDLSYVPTKALLYLERLQSININYATIVEVAAVAFGNLTTLQEIMLCHDHIETLQQYAFAHLPNVTLISLEDNVILEIGKNAFYDLPKLQKLIFTKNNITVISDGAFQHMFNLLELDFNKNNIFHLNRRTFDGLANLKKLDLRKNHIFNLTEFTFAELWNLQDLLLGKNDIKYISERAFDGMSQLEKLSLDDNKIVAIPARLFEGVRGLSSLDLRSNQLHALTFENINPIIDNLKPPNSNLQLEDNRFVCDCTLKWMYFLRNDTNSQTTKDSLDEVTCKMDSPIVSSAYNKISDDSKIDYNQEIVYSGMTIDMLDKDNGTAKRVDDSNEIVGTKKGTKRNVLKIPPETLPCPEIVKTTERPRYVKSNDPAMPIRNEMKPFRFNEMNKSHVDTVFHLVILMSVCFVFFFT